MNFQTLSNTPFTRSKNDLDLYLDRNRDCDPENVPVYTGHSLFNTTKRITSLFIVQSLLHRNPPNIWITIIWYDKCQGGPVIKCLLMVCLCIFANKVLKCTY